MHISEHPLVQWLESRKIDNQTEIAVDRWLESTAAAEDAIAIALEIEKWLEHRDRTPDLLRFLYWYGYANLLIQGMSQAPFGVSEQELDRWRNSYVWPTIEDLESRIAGAAGGFLEFAGRNPRTTFQIIQGQLDERLQKLDELLALPLEPHINGYTPREMSVEDIEDGDDSWQQDHFDRPFSLRDQLECFAWALERLRLLSVTENDEELGLPNTKLHDALMKIDLNALHKNFQEIDLQLRRILKHLARYNYYELNSHIAPESFWWRHWRKRQE